MREIIFFGDSLTAGYGLASPSMESFPALLQEKINKAGLAYKVINSGVSGDTSAAGLSRIAGVLERPIDVFVLELGANDMLRGLMPQSTLKNLQEILNKVKARHPEVKLLLLGMELPAWVPGERAQGFREVYRKLASDYDMAFVPFLLEGVAGMRHLNLVDGVHPVAEGYQIIANTVWPVLRGLLTYTEEQGI